MPATIANKEHCDRCGDRVVLERSGFFTGQDVAIPSRSECARLCSLCYDKSLRMYDQVTHDYFKRFMEGEEPR